MPFLSTFLFGSFTALFTIKILKTTSKILPYYTSSSKFIQKNLNNQTKRIAIILGGTDGIGKEYAKFLNEHNYQIIVVSRNKQKIIEILQSLRKNNNNQSEQKNHKVQENQNYFIHDFSKIDLKSSQSLLLNLSQRLINKNICKQNSYKLKKIQIGVVNCVGEAHINRYEDMPLSQINKLNSVNINPFHLGLNLVNLISKQLNKKCLQKEIFFVNISSAVGEYPNPYSSIYSACKAYQSNLMKALNLQRLNCNKNRKIIYLNIKPYYVSTKMIKFMKSWDVAQPIDIVQGTFKVLQKKQEAAGCVKHELLFCFSFLVNYFIKQRPKRALEVNDKIIALLKNKRERKKQNDQR